VDNVMFMQICDFPVPAAPTISVTSPVYRPPSKSSSKFLQPVKIRKKKRVHLNKANC